MSFSDIRRISYERLFNRVAMDRPYKDSGNAYPLGDRKYSNRHFRDEGDGVFTLWYADRETVDNKYGKANDKASNYGKNNDWYNKCMIGIVRSDNSFEFVVSGGQGENMLLSQGLSANVHNVASKGGLVCEKGNYIHPVFKGLRINCDTGEAMTDYEVFLPKVKRKDANEVMSQYSEFMSVFETMVKAMDDKGIWEVYTDMYIHEANNTPEIWRAMNISTVKRLVGEKKYVDAGCLFTMLSKISNMRWRTEWIMNDSNGTGIITNPSVSRISGQSLPMAWRDRAITDVKVNFRKMILKEHPEVFNFEKLESGAELPASQWGLRVLSGGKIVERF